MSGSTGKTTRATRRMRRNASRDARMAALRAAKEPEWITAHEGNRPGQTRTRNGDAERAERRQRTQKAREAKKAKDDAKREREERRRALNASARASASSSSSPLSSNNDEVVVEYGTVSDSGYSMLVAEQLVRLPKVSELDEEQRDLLIREDKIMGGGIRIIGGSFSGFYHEQPDRPFFVDVEGKKFWDDMGLRRALLLKRSQEVA